MKYSNTNLVNLASLVASLALGSAGCDRSWRDENFTTPRATAGEGDVPPRVRPNVPTGTNPTTVLPLTPGQPAPGGQASNGDAGVPGLGTDHSGDASVEPNMPPDDTGEPAPPQTDATNDVDTDSDPGETKTPGGQASGAPPASSAPGDETSDGEVEPPDEPAPFSKLALLQAASACAMAEYDAFAQRAEALRLAVDAIEDDASLQLARQAFVDAMLRFQRVEGFRVGPAARAMDPGGQDLRDWIYSFPTQNRCQVDRNIVSEVYATNFDSVLFNARGLLALEYLLFERGTTNVCTAGIDINIKGTWAALSQSQLNARRDAYARVLSQDIAERANQLVRAWAADAGNFVAQVENAGDGSAVFATQQAALNAFSHALFYVERELKDYKLGLPLGIVAECTASNGCPHMAELPYSGLSGPSITQNLIAFRSLFEGCGADYAGVGFDDWLREAGQAELADRMLSNLSAAEQAVSSLPRLLEDAFYDAPDEARAVHTAIKGVTDLLKTEFVSVLNLELPMTAEGDND